MKVLILLGLVAVASADVSHILGSHHHHQAQPIPQQRYQSPSSPTRPPPAILAQSQETSEQGDYRFNFKTENGIEAASQAELRNAGSKDEALVSQGTYSYVGEDGQTYSVNWIADEYGFRASGAHIPEVPAEIQKSLELNANGPEDDGQYHPERYEPQRRF